MPIDTLPCYYVLLILDRNPEASPHDTLTLTDAHSAGTSRWGRSQRKPVTPNFGLHGLLVNNFFRSVHYYFTNFWLLIAHGFGMTPLICAAGAFIFRLTPHLSSQLIAFAYDPSYLTTFQIDPSSGNNSKYILKSQNNTHTPRPNTG